MGSPKVKAWSEEEDCVLRELVEKHGEKHWTAIGEEFKTRVPDTKRSSIHCRDRYMNHLQNDLNKSSLTVEEMNLIFELHRKYANRWSMIAKHMPGRTQNMIKGFFYSALRKAKQKFNRERGKKKKCTRTIKSLVRDQKTTLLLKMEPDRDSDEQQEETQEVSNGEETIDERKRQVVYEWIWWWNYYVYLSHQVSNLQA